MQTMTLRPCTVEDNTLTKGDRIYKPYVDGYFMPYDIVGEELKTAKRQPTGDPHHPDYIEYKTHQVRSITNSETGTHQDPDNMGRAEFGSYYVQCTPDDPEAVTAQVYDITATYLTLRVESDNLDTAAAMEEALTVLEAAGFRRRRGSTASPDTELREHLFASMGNESMPIALNVSHKDVVHLAAENGLGQGYRTMVSAPNIPIG